MDLKAIGSRIKCVRKALDLTQRDFSEKLNISIATISGYENGRKKPNVNFLISVATQFNVSMDYLILGKGKQFSQEKTGLDDFLKDHLFGDQTDNVRKILWTMEHSSMVLSTLLGYSLGYLYNNEESIKKDVQENELKRKEKDK